MWYPGNQIKRDCKKTGGAAMANAAERLRSSKKRPLLALAMARGAVLVLQWGQKSGCGSLMREQRMQAIFSESLI